MAYNICNIFVLLIKLTFKEIKSILKSHSLYWLTTRTFRVHTQEGYEMVTKVGQLISYNELSLVFCKLQIIEAHAC